MIRRAAARWAMLSLRERVLIAVMAALFAIVLLWLAVVRPVQDGLARARADHAVAVDRAGRIAAAVASLRGAAQRPPVLSAALTQYVAQSAAEAGFTLDSANSEGADRMTIAVGAARAPAMFAWLAGLERAGIRVETLIVTPTGSGGAGGTVATRATLRAVR